MDEVGRGGASRRLFLAIEPSEGVREAAAALTAALRPRFPTLRFVAPERLHLTLRFLESVAETRIEGLSASLARHLEGGTGFELTLDRLGCFPSCRRARVFWAGPSRAPDMLAAVHRRSEEAFLEQGFASESRPFRPHLTLARVRRPPADLTGAVRSAEAVSLGPTPVQELTLFESRLMPGGPRYTPLGRYPLLGQGGQRLL